MGKKATENKKEILPVPVVILAGGKGTRYKKRFKLLLRVWGKPVIVHTVENALRSALRPVFVITGFQSWAIRNALKAMLAMPGIYLLENPDWIEGKASSIRLAIRNLPENTPGCVFLLGDMPLIFPGLIRKVGETLLKYDRIVLPGTAQDIGHPVAFPARFFPALLELKGEEGGKTIIQKYSDEVLYLPPLPEAYIDLDQEKDLLARNLWMKKQKTLKRRENEE
ncbi:MAG: nucleotidyltransferase family protein [bacterium]